MLRTSLRTSLRVGAAAALAVTLAASGCSNATECIEPSADQASEDGAVSAPDTPLVAPLIVNTGTDGTHVFRAIITSNFGQVEWTSSDDDVAIVQRIGCVQQTDIATATAVVTARAEGAATITGVSGGFTTEVSVNVLSYTPEDYDIGQARYNNPDDPTGERRACADCHFGANAIPHTPLEMAEYTDAELLQVTQTGIEPDRCLLGGAGGARCDCEPVGVDPVTACEACGVAECALVVGRELALGGFDDAGHGDHAWDVAANEEAGIIAFMRGIAPSGF